MKKVLLCLSVIFVCYSSFAQEATEGDGPKNVIKLNLGGLALTAIPLQYERVLSKNMSVALAVTFVPSRSLPSTISSDEITDAKFKGYAITPEFRFYPGKKEEHQAPHGFYLAPFFRLASYTLGSPYVFTTSDTVSGTVYTHTSHVDIEAKYKAVGGGLMIGMQWLIKKRVSIDWWILGFQGGSATPSISLTGSEFASLDADQQQELEKKLDDLGKSIPFATSHTATVDNSGAKLTIKMPYVGFRSGLCIGIAF